MTDKLLSFLIYVIFKAHAPLVFGPSISRASAPIPVGYDKSRDTSIIHFSYVLFSLHIVKSRPCEVGGHCRLRVCSSGGMVVYNGLVRPRCEDTLDRPKSSSKGGRKNSTDGITKILWME